MPDLILETFAVAFHIRINRELTCSVFFHVLEGSQLHSGGWMNQNGHWITTRNPTCLESSLYLTRWKNQEFKACHPHPSPKQGVDCTVQRLIVVGGGLRWEAMVTQGIAHQVEHDEILHMDGGPGRTMTAEVVDKLPAIGDSIPELYNEDTPPVKTWRPFLDCFRHLFSV